MPAGMELFPAIDDAAWNLIKSVIDASDYYVLIVGGRYGSMHEDGLSFTEKEYDYAVEQKKRVIGLLHGTPEQIPRAKTETDEKQWARLTDFRKKVSTRHTCLFWSSAQELKAHVIVSLTSTIKRHPAVGWVRADSVPTGATVEEILTLRDQVALLEARLEAARTSPKPGTSDFLQGDDDFDIWGSISTTTHTWRVYPATTTWDEVFGAVAPILLNEATDSDLKTKINRVLTAEIAQEFRDDENNKDQGLPNVGLDTSLVDTCIVQFRALGLIAESQRKRSVTDSRKYWSLTPYGDSRLVQLRALRKSDLHA